MDQTQAPAELGAAYEGGFYGGLILINAAVFAIAWAPKAEGDFSGIWLPKYTSSPNAISCFDSMTNTRAMAEAGSPIAQSALALRINGHADWCVPARDVLELGYRLLKPTDDENAASWRDGDNASSVPVGYPYTEESPVQTSALAFQRGGAEAFEPSWYWSSTQSSASDAYDQDFLDGTQGSDYKKAEGRVRAVRMIPLNP